MMRVAVVTGGTRGIGAAISKALAEAGYAVAATYSGNDEAAARFHAETGVSVYKWDVGDYDACVAGLAKVAADLGPVDVVINNAGVSFRHLALEITSVEWQQVLQTNLTGVFNVAQVAGRRMLEAGGGVIINVASTNALVGHPHYAGYNATKAAVLALTRTLALEWAPSVRVNAVCPGYVMTPMQEAEYSPEMIAAVNAMIPLGRHARPDELAALLAFLACDEAAYMTGSTIVMDGGETAGGLASR